MADYAHLRLKDRIAKDARVLFVGINPGVRSAISGHHFAGPSNGFWKLLHASGFVDEPVTHDFDDQLPSLGYGITNIVARPTPGVMDLTQAEMRAGRAALERKVRRYSPKIVALVGITVYRALFPGPRAVKPGRTDDTLGGAPVWVLPNPSGRNAHYSYDEMVQAFRALRISAARTARS
ncbi:MAG: mismatch-specific DNA-glycosylase [Acidobacteriota bacterium]|nr:mismatch-specific DNA-glycosylase [Acidobacteriota bacterium]